MTAIIPSPGTHAQTRLQARSRHRRVLGPTPAPAVRHPRSARAAPRRAGSVGSSHAPPHSGSQPSHALPDGLLSVTARRKRGRCARVLEAEILDVGCRMSNVGCGGDRVLLSPRRTPAFASFLSFMDLPGCLNGVRTRRRRGCGAAVVNCRVRWALRGDRVRVGVGERCVGGEQRKRGGHRWACVRWSWRATPRCWATQMSDPDLTVYLRGRCG